MSALVYLYIQRLLLRITMTMAMAIVTSHEAFNELGLGIEAVNHPASFEGLLLKISSYFVVPFIIKENIY